MKTKPKIGPLSVWIVGHPQNPLIAGEDSNVGNKTTYGPRAVFYRKSEAQAWRKKHGGVYALQRATIIREGTGPDYKAQRDAAESALAMERIAIRNLQDELAKSERAHAETEQKLLDLQKQIHDGKIWNTENPRWTPRTQAALALAAKEAQAQGATYVGTEHVLLGLLKQGEGIAHRHFVASGMTYDKAEYAMRVGRCS